jgi:D-3-phosphoglycerate dehydrogenase
MAKYKVMVSAPYMQPVIDRFRKLFEEKGIELAIPLVDERMEENELLDWIGDVDGVICGDDRFTEQVLEEAPKLKVISKWGTGIDSINQEACHERGITVCNTPDAFSIPVADSVIGYVLCFARNLPFMDRAMKKGRWEKKSGRALHECTLGIIGVGDVGSVVAERAASFGMTVLGNDIEPVDEKVVDKANMNLMEKEELLQQSDFVSLNTDLNETSHHLMSDEQFRMMGDEAVLINASRGPVVDETALIAALQANQIGGAALDVFEEEPLPAGSPLRQIDNVMLASHNANSSPKAWSHVHKNTIKNLLEELTGDSPSLESIEQRT